MTLLKPCIIGYFVEPFPAFPLFTTPELRANEPLPYNCMTDNFLDHNQLNESGDVSHEMPDRVESESRAALWPKGQVFHIFFLG